MRIAHPTSTGVIAAGSYKVYGITVTPGADDASITIVNSSDGAGSPETVDTVLAKASTSTNQVVYGGGGINAGLGIYVSAISGTGATFGIQFDG